MSWAMQSGLSQVFINLINNAVKFSPEGKTVEVVATKRTRSVKRASPSSITDWASRLTPSRICSSVSIAPGM